MTNLIDNMSWRDDEDDGFYKTYQLTHNGVVYDIPFNVMVELPLCVVEDSKRTVKNTLKGKYFCEKNGTKTRYFKILEDEQEKTNSAFVNFKALVVEKDSNKNSFSYSKQIYYCEFQYKYVNIYGNEICKDDFIKAFNEVVNEFKHELAEHIEL